MSVKDNPEFMKALKEACEGKHDEIQNLEKIDFSKIREDMDKIATDMKAEGDRIRSEAGSIRSRAEADRLTAFNRVYGGSGKYAPPRRSIAELRIMNNPAHREITETLRRKLNPDGLRCPICGDLDHGNKKNKKSWCLKCDAPLLPVEEHEEWLEAQPDEPKKKENIIHGYNEAEDRVKGRLKKNG